MQDYNYIFTVSYKDNIPGLEILWKIWLAIIANQNENWLATKTFWFANVFIFAKCCLFGD